MDLISVIVPVYKVEKYLDRCVGSIVDQTYKNLEIILVDDGSPDSCPQMCDQWAQKDQRIKVIHKQNGGLSDARNAGMKIATGEYISFVDSDDWIHPDYAEALYKACINNNVKMAACDIETIFENHEAQYLDAEREVSVFSPKEAMYYLTHGQKVRAVAWNKMYHKTLLEKEEFPVARYHEDEFFTYRIVYKANEIAYIDIPMYFYFQRAGSIMNSYSIRHLDALDAALERIEFLKDKYPDIYLSDKSLFCMTCVNLYSNAINMALKDRATYKKRIKKYRSSLNFTVKELLQYSAKEKIYIFGSRLFIGILCKAINTKRNYNREQISR